MSLTPDQLLWRTAMVLERINIDERIHKLGTAILLCRKTLGWRETEDEELRLHVVAHLKAERARRGKSWHIDCMQERFKRHCPSAWRKQQEKKAHELRRAKGDQASV